MELIRSGKLLSRAEPNCLHEACLSTYVGKIDFVVITAISHSRGTLQVQGQTRSELYLPEKSRTSKAF